MENIKAYIGCIGSCIIRDIVGMHEDNAGYVVERFVQSLNPISMVGKSPLLKEFDAADVLSDKTHFYQRCISLDLNKRVFEFTGEGKKKDFLLIDFGCMRHPIFETKEGCGTVVFPEKVPLLLEKGYISHYSVKPTLKYSTDEIHACLDHYFEEVLRICKEEQIIIVDVRCCLYTSNDKTKRLSVFNETEIKEDNAAIDIAYQYALSQLPKAHMIPFPPHMMCDTNHKWGNAKLHYIKEYYKYALKALDTITSGRYDVDTEKLIISALCDDVDRYCMRRKEEFTYFTTKYKVYLDDLCGRYRMYEQYFKTIVMENKVETLRKFFQGCQTHTIGFYGLNEISKCFIDMLCGTDSYDKEKILIIENGITEYQGLTACSRDAAEFLKIENIIICDITNVQKIKDKLKRSCYSGRVIDLYEIANGEKL